MPRGVGISARLLGFWNFVRVVIGAWRRVKFVIEFAKFKQLSLNHDSRFPIVWKDQYPCLNGTTKLHI